MGIRPVLKQLWDRQKGECHYCGILMTKGVLHNPDRITSDHVIPKSKGGKNDISNLVGACWVCNNARGTLDCEHFSAFVKKNGRPLGRGPGLIPKALAAEWLARRKAKEVARKLMRSKDLAREKEIDEDIRYRMSEIKK